MRKRPFLALKLARSTRLFSAARTTRLRASICAPCSAHVQLIDNGQAIARQTRRLLINPAPLTAVPGQVGLFSTGDPRTLMAAAQRWLGLAAKVDLLPFLTAAELAAVVKQLLVC